MPRNVKLWGAAVAFASLITFGFLQGLPNRAVTAQEPNPTPTPKPEEPPTNLSTCCELMNPGGRTLGGPATSRHLLSAPDHEKRVFQSISKKAICVTATNLLPHVPFRANEMILQLEDAGGVFINGGETKTLCGRTDTVTVDCSGDGAFGCTQVFFRWRVDDAQ